MDFFTPEKKTLYTPEEIEEAYGDLEFEADRSITTDSGSITI